MCVYVYLTAECAMSSYVRILGYSLDLRRSCLLTLCSIYSGPRLYVHINYFYYTYTKQAIARGASYSTYPTLHNIIYECAYYYRYFLHNYILCTCSDRFKWVATLKYTVLTCLYTLLFCYFCHNNPSRTNTCAIIFPICCVVTTVSMYKCTTCRKLYMWIDCVHTLTEFCSDNPQACVYFYF